MPRAIDLTGRRFGRWTVLEYSHSAGVPKKRYWLCKCDCGTVRNVASGDLLSGRSKSCGCLQREAAAKAQRKHGHTSTTSVSKEWRAWKAMKERCYNPNHKSYIDYGGRGIKVCDRWLHSFENFLADMGEAPTAMHSLDRINVNGDYSPENCRWATATEQARNTRRSFFVVIGGVRKTVAEWAEIVEMRPSTIFKRLARGWTYSQAVLGKGVYVG